MTCIAGRVLGSRVELSADSLYNDEVNTIGFEPKAWVVRPEVVMGAAGLGAWGVLLQHELYLKRPPREGIAAYVHKTVVPALRALRQEHFPEDSSEMLLGVRGELYCLDATLCAFRSREGYAAIGSGGPVAAGALHAGATTAQAVAAAIAHASHCGGPVVTIATKEESGRTSRCR